MLIAATGRGRAAAVWVRDARRAGCIALRWLLRLALGHHEVWSCLRGLPCNTAPRLQLLPVTLAHRALKRRVHGLFCGTAHVSSAAARAIADLRVERRLRALCCGAGPASTAAARAVNPLCRGCCRAAYQEGRVRCRVEHARLGAAARAMFRDFINLLRPGLLPGLPAAKTALIRRGRPAALLTPHVGRP